jgi:peptidoglycan/LPS O-acetylase OafA/YrhL
VAVLAWRCLLVFHLHVPKDRTYVASDTRMDSLLFGCALAVYGNPVLDRMKVSIRRLNTVWLPLGGLGLLLSFVIRNQHFQETFRYSLQGVALVPFFVAAIRQHDRGIFRLLNLRWVRYVGVISYCIYLLHPSVLYALQGHRLTGMPPAVQGVLGVVCSVALAAAIHHVVERPCARLRRRLSRVQVDPGNPAKASDPTNVIAGRQTLGPVERPLIT